MYILVTYYGNSGDPWVLRFNSRQAAEEHARVQLEHTRGESTVHKTTDTSLEPVSRFKTGEFLREVRHQGYVENRYAVEEV
jgi:hypothetical protein